MTEQNKAVDQNDDADDVQAHEADKKNPKLKEPIALKDLLTKLVAGDYTDLPVYNKKVANGRPVTSKTHTVEPLRVHKKTRPSPTTVIISTETYFLLSMVEKMILINEDIMPGKCTVDGCNCSTMGKAMKEEILDWVNKNAPDIKVVLTTEDKLSDLFYEGYIEFFADNINFEAQPQT